MFETMQSNGRKVTSVDINPVVQYNGTGDSDGLHSGNVPSCATGAGKYEPRPLPVLPFVSVRPTFVEDTCMLVKYVAHFADNTSKEMFLHAPFPVKYKWVNPQINLLEKDVLEEYAESQAKLLSARGFAVNIGHLQNYHGAADPILGLFSYRRRMQQEKAA